MNPLDCSNIHTFGTCQIIESNHVLGETRWQRVSYLSAISYLDRGTLRYDALTQWALVDAELRLPFANGSEVAHSSWHASGVATRTAAPKSFERLAACQFA